MRVSWSALLAGVAACQFERPPDVGEVDAAPSCVASTIDCDDGAGVYTECSAEGFPVRQMTCPLGCAPDLERCLDIDPRNELAMYLDMARDSPLAGEIDFVGSSAINALTGAATSGGSSVSAPTAMAGSIRVFMFKQVTITGTLKALLGSQAGPTNPPAIAIIADGDIIIDGTLDVSADAHRAGPGLYENAHLNCGGRGSELPETPPTPGGGGGGNYSQGGRGGSDSNSVIGFGGGAPLVGPVEPLLRGCGGGSIAERGDEQEGNNAYGGGGGGAIQLVSRTRIWIRDGGTIDASGGGAFCAQYFPANGSPTAAAGGGSGGTVLLEAPDVILEGTNAVISTKGGGGSAPGHCVPMNQGADGGTAAAPAAGGTSELAGYPRGGAGGTGTSAPEPGGNGTGTGVDGGGGGGAVGLTAIYTRSGLFTPQAGATVNSGIRVGTVRSRHAP